MIEMSSTQTNTFLLLSLLNRLNSNISVFRTDYCDGSQQTTSAGLSKSRQESDRDGTPDQVEHIIREGKMRGLVKNYTNYSSFQYERKGAQCTHSVSIDKIDDYKEVVKRSREMRQEEVVIPVSKTVKKYLAENAEMVDECKSCATYHSHLIT